MIWVIAYIIIGLVTATVLAAFDPDSPKDTPVSGKEAGWALFAGLVWPFSWAIAIICLGGTIIRTAIK